MTSAGTPPAPVLRDPGTVSELVDRGPVPTMIEGQSRTSGGLLCKAAEGHPDSGLWVCAPGDWECRVTGDQLCHFRSGRCTYTHVLGAVIHLSTLALAIPPSPSLCGSRAGHRGGRHPSPSPSPSPARPVPGPVWRDPRDDGVFLGAAGKSD